MIIDALNDLILESAAKKSEKNKKQQDKGETEEGFHSRIKYNRWKKALLKSNTIRIGQPKQLFGPHEGHIRDSFVKAQTLEKQEQSRVAKEQSDMNKQKHDANMKQLSMKLTPTKPKVEKKPVAPSLQPSTKDVLPTDSTPQEKVMKRIISLTKGMKNSIKGYTCNNCGFPVPKYRGRYPTDCVNCGKPLNDKKPIVGRTKKK